MNGDVRRDAILAAITEAEKPISASFLAKQFKVSRQVIVGDVALLRAMGSDIYATARGYLLHQESTRYVRRIAVNHTMVETQDELLALINLGVHVIDVTVEHAVYGEITGKLNLESLEDVERFLEDIQTGNVELLSTLTQGVHLHTLSCRDEDHFNAAYERLKELGFTIENN